MYTKITTVRVILYIWAGCQSGRLHGVSSPWVWCYSTETCRQINKIYVRVCCVYLLV